MTSIAVCIAVYNRREKTLACLRRLFSAELPEDTSVTVHLLDDSSSDGTALAVAEHFPQVQIHHGDGNCFWAGGMRISYGAAIAEKHDYYLWLNDDVELFGDALRRALETERGLRRIHGGEHLIVGAMHARDTQTTTYSGLVRSSKLLPWKFMLVSPASDRPIACDTLNGNFVLIPASLAHRLGNIDPELIHMHADLVLGLMARRAGARNWIMPGYAGICDANTIGRKNWNAPGLSLSERFKTMEHPLGYPLRASVAFSRCFGLWAPIMVAAPYAKLLWATLTARRHASPRDRG